MYDIFYVSKVNGNDNDWSKIKSRFPLAQRLSNITTFDQVKSKAFTKMFWIIWDDIDLTDTFDLLGYRATKWDDMYIHVFKNDENYDGICLFPKSVNPSQREFCHRFFTEKKEIDITASRPKRYNIYTPRSYEEYLDIQDEMFWIVWPEIEIVNNNILDLYFSHHNTYDRRENHVFKNSYQDNESYTSGLVLFSKYKKISKKEFDARYLVDKKEHDIVATAYKKQQYNIYSTSSYEEYLKILEEETNLMFWIVWPEIEITDQTIFDLFYHPFDPRCKHDINENHVFKNKFNEEEVYINGSVLFSKQKPISRREFLHRYLIEKKEHDILVSKHRLYDVVFISYNESNAEKNYDKLVKQCPRAKRVDGIKGIHQAHITAANLCDTEMFWVVDGDAEIEKDFNFDLVMSSYDIDCVHVWKSRNPVNDLEYGNGGVKLLPRKLTLEMDINTTDMTTSISKKFKAMTTVSNTTSFNTTPFDTWKSAFRECVKLVSRSIERQDETETIERLNIWCTKGIDRVFGEYAIEGSLMGKQFGELHKSDPSMLSKINDFDWLKEFYESQRKKLD